MLTKSLSEPSSEELQKRAFDNHVRNHIWVLEFFIHPERAGLQVGNARGNSRSEYIDFGILKPVFHPAVIDAYKKTARSAQSEIGSMDLSCRNVHQAARGKDRRPRAHRLSQPAGKRKHHVGIIVVVASRGSRPSVESSSTLDTRVLESKLVADRCNDSSFSRYTCGTLVRWSHPQDYTSLDQLPPRFSPAVVRLWADPRLSKYCWARFNILVMSEPASCVMGTARRAVE
jgi:hypothetical protein